MKKYVGQRKRLGLIGRVDQRVVAANGLREETARRLGPRAAAALEAIALGEDVEQDQRTLGAFRAVIIRRFTLRETSGRMGFVRQNSNVTIGKELGWPLWMSRPSYRPAHWGKGVL